MDPININLGDNQSKYLRGLPTWARGVIIIGVLGVSYIFLNQIIKKIRQEAELKKAQEKLSADRGELQNQIDNGVPRSYDKSVYNAMASAIKDAFDGCDPSLTSPVVLEEMDLTDSGKKLYAQLRRLNNDRDFLELVDSWGITTYDACGWGTGDEENKTLYEAVSNELGQAEIKFLNKKLNERGITLGFR